MASPSPSPPSLSPTPHPAAHHAPTAPPSKRDKRRANLSDKLTSMTATFHNPPDPRARDEHFRHQVLSLQCDSSLIARVDTSGRDMRLLDDSVERVQEEVDGMLTSLVGSPSRAREAASEGMAGRWYAQFLQRVNEHMEERDAELTRIHDEHTQKEKGILAQHARALILAREEHRALTKTIKARLTASLKSQLKKLASEKESSSTSANPLSSLAHGGLSDITESSPFLLHPSHYGTTSGIGSPRRNHRDVDEDTEGEKGGSSHHRRKPRRRGGDLDDLLSYGMGLQAEANGLAKRKRRADHDADTSTPVDAGSPTDLSFEADDLEPNENTKKRKKEEIMKQMYTPVYTIPRLFSEKELAMYANEANMNARRFFTDRAKQPSEPITTAATPASASELAVPMQVDEDGMRERQGSPLPNGYGMNTRSRIHAMAGMETKELHDMALAGMGVVGMTYLNKNQVAPAPPPLSNMEAESDLQAMRLQCGRSGGEKGKGRGR